MTMEKMPALIPGVSAVVCCHNSAAVIAPAIQALSAQKVPEGAGFEVILVDNNCTDNTVSLAESSWNNTAYPLRMVTEREPGLMHARRAGVRSARHDILLFVDDDNIVADNWVETLFALFRKFPGAGVIGGCNRPRFLGPKPEWFDRFAEVYACTPRKPPTGGLPDKKTLPGAGLAFRTAVIRSLCSADLPLFLVGRTQDTLSRGEDSELCLRAALMSWEVVQEPALVLEHCILSGRLNWDYVLRAKKGGGAAAVILKIYQKLVKRETPLSYREVSEDLSRKWRYFWNNLEDKAELEKEGSRKAFRHSYLQGFSEKLESMGEKQYDLLREQIIRFYA